MAMHCNEVLITGADGYLGKRIARQLLLDYPDIVVNLWLRAADAAAWQEKIAGLQAFLPAWERVRCWQGDLRDEDPFCSVPAQNIEAIIHTAAVIRFNVESALADAVNTEGSRKMAVFARRCPQLKALLYLGTLYASGEQAGVIREDQPLAPAAFANHYERSKFAAEQALRSVSPVPPMIVRVPTLIAEDSSGCVGQLNAFHNTLRLLYNGLISVLPGNPDTPLYFSATDEVVTAVLAVLANGVAGCTYHACPAREYTVTLQDALDESFLAFSAHPNFAKKRILPPALVDAASFGTLASAMQGMSGGIVSGALDSILPFSRQLYVTKQVDNRNMLALSPGLFQRDGRALVNAATHWLIRSQWTAQA